MIFRVLILEIILDFLLGELILIVRKRVVLENEELVIFRIFNDRSIFCEVEDWRFLDLKYLDCFCGFSRGLWSDIGVEE